jgi:hypothetical protein
MAGFTSAIPITPTGHQGGITPLSGATSFLVSSSQKSKLRRVDTLTQAREIVVGIIQRDAQAQKLHAAGWCKEENAKQPGVCWRSPYTDRLLTQTEALLELNLMS